MKISKITLRSLFAKGLKPKQEAFWNWMDSFWHKDEEIEIEAVKGLKNTLDNKLDVGVETTLLNTFNEAVSKMNSILKGEATPDSEPTVYDPATHPDGLFEKWEARTVGTYVNFKDASGIPVEVTADDLDKKFVFINMTNGVAKKDTIAIPGTDIDTSFDILSIDKAQNAYNINDWLVNKVKGGESDEIKKIIEEIGDFYKNIGINLAGSSTDGLQAGVYNIKSNSTAVSDSNKFLTKANVRLSVAGNFKFCIGRYDGAKFIVRWESSELSGVVGWNNFDFNNQKVKINNGEMAAILCLATSTAKIYFGDPGAPGNRFVQYSTVAGGTQGNLNSFYALWFELSNIDEITLPSSSELNLAKTVAKNAEYFAKNGYIGVETQKGESVVSSDSDALEGYAINKIELETAYKLERLEISVVTAGTYQIVTGFLEQEGKFIEKNVITKTLTAGLNTVSINPIILEIGDYVGLKFPSKYPVNNSPSTANLWASTSYTGSLVEAPGKSLPIKLFLKEYLESPIAIKADLLPINSSIVGLQQRFVFNGKKVNLTFNIDGTVNWEYLEGYSKILHLGNSIAKHPIVSYWWGSWGMAASEKNKDYVHRFLSKMQELKPAAITDALNIAAWEVSPSTWDKTQLDPYLSGKDLICIRLSENVPSNVPFKDEFASLINYIKTKNNTAKLLIGGAFWADEAKDNAMKEVAKLHNITFVPLSHLNIPANRSAIGAQVKGDDEQWHTVNHSGVASHPGDQGMDAIATELFNALGL